MKKNEVIDLASFDTVAACNKGFEVELRHPGTGQPLGIFWKVVGRHSDIFREYIKEKSNERLCKETLAKKRGKDIPPRTPEEIEEDTIEMLTLCTLGWRTGEASTIHFKGEDVPFNVPNCRKVLTEMLWIREQLDEPIGDLRNFMKN